MFLDCLPVLRVIGLWIIVSSPRVAAQTTGRLLLDANFVHVSSWNRKSGLGDLTNWIPRQRTNHNKSYFYCTQKGQVASRRWCGGWLSRASSRFHTTLKAHRPKVWCMMQKSDATLPGCKAGFLRPTEAMSSSGYAKLVKCCHYRLQLALMPQLPFSRSASLAIKVMGWILIMCRDNQRKEEKDLKCQA